ncbi:zinc-binding dehydrogenase [Halomonas cerina]|uniref:NADPH:quinone reductase-like Zn-dependent oxidoreductase n=1 Tax=Halomonas cerina TaxID=447424 RepID=A0A839VF18_9GAMM|nr:zinc-binding dehydrogenase [Halomonas cerina]MBB3191959.1 NADPH:quinone reductase-like Zn-dependent oxidoreductase [Halomonas cerina]
MKSVVITAHGGNEVVEVREGERPRRQPGEVLVRIEAGTLNQVDLYMRNSGAGITHELPLVMGLDGAGVVEEIDAGEERVSVGQRVVIYPGVSCGRCEFCRRGDNVLCTRMKLLGEHIDGTFAQWISVPVQNVFPMPQHLDFLQAAAMGVNYLTAWRMVFTRAQLKPWETVLVFGVGGGVSLAAMQLARSTGARVIVTSREDDKLEKALELGAHEAINSKTQDVAKTVMALTGGRGVDVVIENVGEAVWSSALKSLVRGGRLVTCGATSGDQPPADLKRIFIRQLQIIGSTSGNLSEFADLLAYVERHGITPVIDSVFPLEDIREALDRLEAGGRMGKVGLDLQH